MAPKMTNGPRSLYLSEILPTRIAKIIPVTKGPPTSSSDLMVVWPNSTAMIGMNRGMAYVEMRRLLDKTHKQTEMDL